MNGWAAYQEHVWATDYANDLKAEIHALRAALRDALTFVDHEAAVDYPAWERLAYPE